MTTIVNARLYDFETFLPDAFVTFDDRIRKVGPMSAFVPDGGIVHDAQGALVMPGLVLAHTHVYSTFARGLSLPFAPRDFRGILEQLWWRVDGALDLDAVAASGAYAAVAYLENGVTAIVDHHASGVIGGSVAALARAMTESAPMRGAFCFETSDRFDVDACIAENLAFGRQAVPGVAGALFGLHASLSLSEATLAEVARRHGDLPVHVHAAESDQDEAECLARYGERVIPRFDRHGLVAPGSLFAHCVHCDPGELDLLAARGATVAVNPTSNMGNGVGLPDVSGMLARGIRVVLGDDGISASAAAEIRALAFAMRHRGGSPLAFSERDLLAVLRNTYDFVGDRIGVKLGRIRPGYAADLVVHDYREPSPLDSDNAFSHFLYGLAPAFRPQDVFVRGTRAVASGRIAPHLAASASGAIAAARRTWTKIRKEESR